MDEHLKKLQGELAAKQSEADALVRKDNPTGEELVRAEKLYDECDGVVRRLDERKAELEHVEKLKGRSAGLAGYRGDPDPAGLPMGAKGGDGFRLQGFEPAGHVKLDAATREVLEEVGPGCFGAKTWEAMSSVEYKRDFVQYLRKGSRHLDLCSKTLQNALDAQGGVFVPADLILRIIGRQPAPTRLRGLVTTINTGRDIVTMPRKQYNSDDKYTTAFRVTWTGEIPASSTAADVDDSNLLGEVEISVHTAMASAPISKNTVEDSAFPVQAWLEGELAQVVDLAYEDMILNGSGITQPFGIYSNPGATDRPEVVLSGSSAALSYDGLVDLQTALAPQYDENANFVMNKKSAYRALYKIKDQNNRPLFANGTINDGLANARQMTLMGYPVVFSQFTQDVGASGYPIVYGDLKGYYLAQRVGFSIMVLDQTRAKLNQIELVGRLRFGGKPVEHWRMKLQKSNNS